ncbi:MAG: hypothetical protein Ct9H300mP30_0130 [Methanobacteriota archaeon]|nr:MAG: hypothetical protein Ct9H300mP30_0130 [Euryarchaeota archaeon]
MGKRTRSQRRGSSPKNKVSSHRFPASNRLPRVNGEIGRVVDLVHSPAHTATLAKVKFDDGTVGHIAAPEGISIGQSVSFGDNVSLRPGKVTSLEQIPEGTPICNVECRPGDGGKLARSGGNSARSRLAWMTRSGYVCPAASTRICHPSAAQPSASCPATAALRNL